jgi:putrescine transport system permease protein
MVPWGERMSSGTRFITFMADRLPPFRWLLRLLPRGRGIVILIPYLWLVAFFLIPFIIVAKISLSESVTAQPPYTEILRHIASGQVSFATPEKSGDAAAPGAAPAAATTTQSADQGSVDTPDGSADIKGGPPEDVSGGYYLKFNWDNYDYLFSDDLYFKAGKNAVFTAFISTVICLLIGFPMAYGIARSPTAWRGTLLMLIILPFWTSFLIRVYAWIGILKNNGVINNILIWLGVIHDPLPMMNTNFAVFIGIVYS